MSGHNQNPYNPSYPNQPYNAGNYQPYGAQGSAPPMGGNNPYQPNYPDNYQYHGSQRNVPSMGGPNPSPYNNPSYSTQGYDPRGFTEPYGSQGNVPGGYNQSYGSQGSAPQMTGPNQNFPQGQHSGGYNQPGSGPSFASAAYDDPRNVRQPTQQSGYSNQFSPIYPSFPCAPPQEYPGNQGPPGNPYCGNAPYSASGGPPPYGVPGYGMPGANQPYSSSSFRGPSIDNENSYMEWFQTMDTDRSGYITWRELQPGLMNSDNQPFSDHICQQLVRRFSHSTPERLNLKDFVVLKKYVTECASDFNRFSTDRYKIVGPQLCEFFKSLGFYRMNKFVDFCMRISQNCLKLDQFTIIKKLVVDSSRIFGEWANVGDSKRPVYYERFMRDCFSVLYI